MRSFLAAAAITALPIAVCALADAYSVTAARWLYATALDVIAGILTAAIRITIILN